MSNTIYSKAGADAAFPQIGMPEKHEQLVDAIRRGKGGRIGTAGKGVIALRIDHQLDAFRTNFLPLFQARGLPFSVGVVTQAVGDSATTYDLSTATTWAQIKSDLLAWGGEVWSHSRTHGNGAGATNYAKAYSEIVSSKADIEAAIPECQVMGWQQPGSPATYGTTHFTPDSMDDTYGRLIRNTYGLYESSLYGSTHRALPTGGCCGLNHLTIDNFTLAQAKGWVDEIIDHAAGAEVMVHPGFVMNLSTSISLADYTAFLDYIVTKRDAGQLSVVTASGLAFADPSTDFRFQLIVGGDFENAVTGTLPRQFATNTSSAAWTIQTDGGHSGSNYLRIPAGQALVIANPAAGQYGMDGHVVRFRGWVRSLDGSPPDWRVQVTSAGRRTDNSNSVVRNATGTTTGTWTKVEQCFTLHKGYDNTAISWGKSGTTAGTIDWDDVTVVPV